MKNDPLTPATRCDLEQQIGVVWGTLEDIKLIYHATDHFNEDELANALLGLEQLFDLRMQELWKYFEECIKTGDI